MDLERMTAVVSSCRMLHGSGPCDTTAVPPEDAVSDKTEDQGGSNQKSYCFNGIFRLQ